MSENSKAGPAAQQDPPKSPTATKQEKTVFQSSATSLAERLLAAGIPVVVCTPCPGYGEPGRCSWKGHGDGTVELHQPKGWPRLTADQCDLSSFRPGVDVLAMVGGHGIDLVDVDTKADGSVNHLPPFVSYGMTRTPSGGEHYVVPSSGLGKLSPLNTLIGHVGDYVGGKPDGSSRLLGYLPGSSRPAYPGGSYVEEVPWDVDACLAAQPDPALVAALEEAGATSTVREEYPADIGPLRPVEEGVHPEATKVVSRALERLQSLSPVWVKGDHWDETHHRVASVLQRVANSNWSGYTMEQAEADYLAHARTDEAWGEDMVELKWRAAEDTVQGGGWVPPYQEFIDEPLPPLTPKHLQPKRPTAEDDFDAEVAKLARSMRVRRAAQELLAREQVDQVELPELTTLAELLEEPDEEARFRVEGLMPTGGRVVFAAAHKAGKTTMVSNLVRCLVDGDDFLGRFPVQRAERVVVLDNELDRRMIRSWLRDQSIESTKSVEVLTLRGKLSGFNILDPVVRSEWAARLGPADLMVFDCLRPALDALGLSEDKDAGRFLVALDALVDEAGIGELVVVHHMGHSSERSRGDSRILDWPDAIWKLVRADAEDHSSERFFSAYGRDVDQSESRLAYDSDTRRLTLSGGSRRQAAGSALEDAVFNYVQDNPGCSGSAIERGVQGDNNAIRQARTNLIESGLLQVVDGGAGKAKQHFLGDHGASDFMDEP